MKTALLLLFATLLGACRIERAASGRPPGAATAADSLARAEQDSAAAAEVEAAVRTYYARFTARDWRVFARSFWPGAIITTRWTPPGESAERVFTQTIDEFVARTGEGPDRLAVFSEEIVRANIVTYGVLADAWVVYRARFGMTRDSVATHHGIDAFHLMHDKGEWRIVSLAFTGEVPGRPLIRRPL